MTRVVIRNGRIVTAADNSRVDYSLFEGFEVTGKAEKVFSRGRLTVDGSSWPGAEGWGRYVGLGCRYVGLGCRYVGLGCRCVGLGCRCVIFINEAVGKRRERSIEIAGRSPEEVAR